ncbi:MAG: PEP-utilizing enzyme [Acidimicrobiales bacterium]
MDLWKPIGGDETGGRWVGHKASTRFPVYTRGNAGEVYPEVFTPLSFSVAAEAAERAMRNAIMMSGLVRPEEVDGIPLTTAVGSGVFGGYAYLNLSIQRLAAARTPGGKATDADVNYLGTGEEPPVHVPGPDEKNRRATLAGVRYLVRTIRRKELPQLAADQRLVANYLAGLPDPATASDAELRESIGGFIPMFGDLFEQHLWVSFDAGLTVAVLTGLCERLLDDPQLVVPLLTGLGDVDSAAPSLAIFAMSRQANDVPEVSAAFDDGVDGLLDRLRALPEAATFLDAFDDFLAEFGSRGPNEWDTAFDTWETEPELALTLISNVRAASDDANPARQQQRLAAEAAKAEAAAVARLPRPARPMFRRVLAAARLYSRSRERSKTTVVRAIHGARLQAMELDRRLVERSGGQRGDLWFLIEPEVDAYLADPASLGETIAERREQHRLLAERVPPFFFSGQQPPLDEWELRTSTREPLPIGEKLTGLPGCPGSATGRARVVTDPGDAAGVGPGDVLIAPLTDPAWTPLFLPAAAVVVDVGAIMSHAVIVSRELGIPCVVSATDASRRIPNGSLVEVDGTAGTVTVIESPT